MQKLMAELGKKCSLYFTKNNYQYTIQGDSRANNMHGGNNNVSVLNLFDNFWIYIEVVFAEKDIEAKFKNSAEKDEYLEENFIYLDKKYFSVLISLSVFQGERDDDEKKQLFRAEWDNYEKNTQHPQPHWHFYPDQKEINNYADLETELQAEEVTFDTFDASISINQISNVDLKKMHFAMSGQWFNGLGQIHRINNGQILIDWFVAILDHIKSQLKYAA